MATDDPLHRGEAYPETYGFLGTRETLERDKESVRGLFYKSTAISSCIGPTLPMGVFAKAFLQPKLSQHFRRLYPTFAIFADDSQSEHLDNYLIYLATNPSQLFHAFVAR